MIRVTIRVATPQNVILGFINQYEKLDYVMRGDGKIGACTFTVPINTYPWFSSSNVDYRITLWRSVNNQSTTLEGEYLTAGFTYSDKDVTVVCVDIQDLLRRRIIAYPANNSTYTEYINKYTGNIMKSLVRTNLTSSFASLRDGNDSFVSLSNLTVDNDSDDGVLMSIACSRNNLYETIQKIAQSSQESGSWIVGVITSDGDNFTFRTYPEVFGVDRRRQQTLSMGNKNVENIELTYDYTMEYNAAIVGGTGTETSRVIGTSLRTASLISPYSRKEYFFSNTQIRTSTDANDYARAAVRANRPMLNFQCSLIQTPDFVRGINYNVGDILYVEFKSAVYETRLDVVQVSISNSGIRERAALRQI